MSIEFIITFEEVLGQIWFTDKKTKYKLKIIDKKLLKWQQQ